MPGVYSNERQATVYDIEVMRRASIVQTDFPDNLPSETTTTTTAAPITTTTTTTTLPPYAGISVLYGWGDNTYLQTGVSDTIYDVLGTEYDWTKVSSGVGHHVALKSNGTLWSWGNNDYGQLGLGNVGIIQTSPTQIGTNDDWIDITAGSFHSIAIKSNGTLWGWGSNNDGQLGLPGTGSYNEPTQIGTGSNWHKVYGGVVSSLGIRTEGSSGSGSLWITEVPLIPTTTTTLPPESTTTTTTPPVSSGITMIANGDYTYYVIKDNNLWVWGYNGEGELGLGDTTDRSLPTQIAGSWKSVAASERNMLAIKSDGSLWGTGYNAGAELGLGDTVQRDTLTLIDNGSWSTVDTYGHSVAIKSDGTLWYTGRDVSLTPIESYPLTVTFTQMGSDTNWVSASAGGDNTLLIKSDGTLWGWGGNNYGELGLSPHTYQGPADPILQEDYVLTPTQIGIYTDWVKISMGQAASAGIRANGTLWTTGYNHWGLLGIGDSRVGDLWGINDYLVETFTQVGTDTDWVDVASGYYYFVARKSNGTLWVWGRNQDGQLGLGTLDDPYYYNVPTQIGSDTDWMKISANGRDTLAIKNNQLAFGGGNLFDYIGTGNIPQAFTVLPYSIP